MDEESPDRGSLPGEPPGAPHRRARHRRLFEECWTPVRAVVEAQLQGALDDALGPLAKSQDAEDEAFAKRVKAILMRERAFVQAYLEAVNAELNASIASFVEARASGQGARALSLVGHADSEFDAAIDQCAARLRNAVDAEFTAAKVRLVNLLHEDLRDSDLPFRIAVFVRAVAGALRHIGTSEADLLAMMRAISGSLGRMVAECYAQIERRLAESGASDTLTVWHATIVGSHNAARGRPTTTGGAAGSDGGRGGRHAVSLDETQQSALLALLGRLQPGVPGEAPQHGAGGAGAAEAAMPTQAERVSLLESRARAPGWTFDPALITAVNDALRAAAANAGAQPAAANAELRRGLIDTASRKLDKLTIELVGLLFDRIQRDRHVPDAIKEQLARLQFPLLKVALGDPELFADARQPARRLLDRIASTSVGWSPAGEDNVRYFEQVRTAVDSVVDWTDDGADAFEQAVQRFEAFLDEERTRDDDPVARARRALAEAENREILAIKATMQVRSAFDGVQLESYLRDFLLDVWVRVLVDAATREKNDPALMRRYLDTIPELVWSVQPKINPGDRKRMIGTIPNVLGVLREGLTRIEWPAERIQQFFGRLMNSHANAVKALELAHGTLPQFTPSTVRIKLDGFRIPSETTDTSDVEPGEIKVSDDAVRHSLSVSAAGVNHLSAPEQKLQSVAIDHGQALKVIAGWKRGLWFDLRTEAGTERVVLRWISPKRALYLLTSAGGLKAHSLSPDTLVAYLQSGWLVPVEAAPLFERLVDGVMSDLKHAEQPDPGAAS